jgi:hypothetical protein
VSFDPGFDDERLREAIRQALNGDAVLFLGAGACNAVKGRKGKSLPIGPALSKVLA